VAFLDKFNKHNMNKRKIISRIIVSPLILGILLFSYGKGCLKHFVKYLRYGGEWVTYSKDEPKSMQEIYKLLKERNQ
jgi:hypothetical protein